MMPASTREKVNEQQRKWYRSNKAKHIASIRRKEKETAEWFANYKTTLSCACGENEPCCLDFHHRDPTTKLFSISRGKKTKKQIIEEIAKCDVLCANCHRKLHNKLKSS